MKIGYSRYINCCKICYCLMLKKKVLRYKNGYCFNIVWENFEYLIEWNDYYCVREILMMDRWGFVYFNFV